MIICDLKQKLLIMGLSDCLTNIRNLEGIIDLDNCLFFSGLYSLN